tara:strand:+ start:167 stop:844 length:678 start_codon:yes stop_codon:yes gene_type:complete
MRNIPVISIDGLSGSGKSTVSKKLSRKLNFYILDSGILYRAFAYLQNINNIECFTEENINSLIKDLALETNEELSFNILYKNSNITRNLHYEEIGLLASSISKNETIRSALLPLQHKCIRAPGLIANGRDMGTKVFPNSKLKIFFTADLDIRAKRRYDQLVKNGSKPNLIDIRNSLQDRDEKDINRDISPLKAAKDAIIIDSSQLNVESVLDKILELYNIKELEI